MGENVILGVLLPFVCVTFLQLLITFHNIDYYGQVTLQVSLFLYARR